MSQFIQTLKRVGFLANYLIVIWIPIFNLILPLISIIFAVEQRRRKPTGLATAGLIIGILLTIASVLITLMILGIFTLLFNL